MNDSGRILFEQEVKNLLNKIKLNDENVFDSKDYDLFTSSGISKLNIPSNSYIEIKYISADNLQAFRQIIFPKNRKIGVVRDIDFNKLFIVCNLTSKRIHDLLNRLPIGKQINVISIDDLRNIELEFVRNSSGLIPYNQQRIRPNKSIQFEQFDEFLLALIRLEIIISAFSSGQANMQNIIAQKESLLPFVYEDRLNKTHIFIAEKSKYSKRSILFDEKAIIHRVDLSPIDNENTNLLIDGNRISFNKISIRWLSKSIPFFNSYARINMFPVDQQYKYRSFGESVESKFDIGKDEYKYTKKVIENKEIYFSKKSQLNDPFDLDADYYGKSLLHTSEDYRIFCTTGKSDNILMWSHYGDSHKGYCTAYYPVDIISSIESEDKIEFCVYGNVNYKPNRKPDAKFIDLILSCFDEETMSFILQINQLFKKFKDWRYEEEFRYIVCLNKDFIDNKSIDDGISIKVDPSEYYFGQRFDFNLKTIAYLKKHIGDECFSYNISKTEYKLEKAVKRL